MRIKVLADGENALRLETSNGVPIGWVRGRVVGFRGLPGEHEALRALVAVWPTYQTTLRQHYSGWPQQDVTLDELEIANDGAYEWIVHEGRPIARLLRVRSKPPVLGLEFVLPSYANEGTVVSVAQVLGGALAPHLSHGSEVPLAGRYTPGTGLRTPPDGGPLPPAA